MGLSKDQIKEHIANVEKRLCSDKERKLRGYEFAKLSYQVKDYNTAIGYLKGYLEEKPKDYRAHMWMGKLYELVKNHLQAIVYYESFLELKSDQKDIILKVAELYQELKNPPVEKLQKYLDFVRGQFGPHPIVYSLKEKLRMLEGKPLDHSAQEEFLVQELSEYSQDAAPYVQLVQHYENQGTIKEAYEFCKAVSEKGNLDKNEEWLECSLATCEKYLHHSEMTGEESPVVTLDCLVSLLWHSILKFKLELSVLVQGSVISATSKRRLLELVLKVNQKLHESQILLKSLDAESDKSFYEMVVCELGGQLYLMTAQYLYLMDQNEDNREIPSQEVQLGDWCLMCSLRAIPSRVGGVATVNSETWYNVACTRQSLVGWQVLLIDSYRARGYFESTQQVLKMKEDRFFLIKSLLKESNVKSTSSDTFDLKKSFLAADTSFLDVPLPTIDDLSICDQEFLSSGTCEISILVWLYLAQKSVGEIPPVSEWMLLLFPDLPFATTSLMQCSSSSLCRCDLEAFLILQSYECEQNLISSPLNVSQTVRESLATYPPCCLRAAVPDSNTWNDLVSFAATGTVQKSPKNEIEAHLRLVRGCVPVQLSEDQLLVLARHFKIMGCSQWSSHYWSILEKISVGRVGLDSEDKGITDQSSITPETPVSPGYVRSISPNEKDMKYTDSSTIPIGRFVSKSPASEIVSETPVISSSVTSNTAVEERDSDDNYLLPTEEYLSLGSEDNEVCFLFEELPDPELVSKAELLMLPPSFYLFESKPVCGGCRGCLDDDLEDSTANSSHFYRNMTGSDFSEPPNTGTSHDASPTSKEASSSTAAVIERQISSNSNQQAFLSTGMLSFTDIAKGDADVFRKETGFQFQGTGLQLFGSHHNEASESEEYEPDVDFKPLVSLPDEYEYKSGGDDGTVLFEHRCKLYRHDERSNEWKERGLGNIRIFLQVSNQKPRIIMRRDQILKLCCNHYITKDMKLLPKDNDRCWAWQSHSDYSEETPRKESFAVRFKTASVAEEFRRVFQECIDKVPFLKSESTEGRIEEHHCNVSQESLQWECSECYCFNSDNTDKCMACLAPKPNTTSITSINPVNFPTISKASPPSPHAVSSNGMKESNNTELTHSNSRIQLALLQAESEEKDYSRASSNMISTELISTAKEDTNVSELSSIPKVFTPSAKSMSNTSESSAVEESAAGCNDDNLTLSEKYQNLNLDGEVSFLFEELPDPELVTKAKALMLPPSFYLFEAKPKCSGCRGCSDDDSVEDHTAKSSDSHREVLDSEYSDHPATGISHDASSSFKEVLSLTAEVVEEHLDVNPNLKTFVSTEMLSFTDIAKGDAFGFRKETGFQFQGTGLQLFGSHHNEASESEEYEPDVDFKPLVSLPDEYEYKSGGDDGMVLFEHRCKLYRHDERSNEWKERGLGNIRIFLQASNQKPRIIMRRDQILKLCCNHYITKDMKLLPKDNDRCWAWQSHSDYSEETPRKESFTVRFKTASVAEEFRRVFQECVEKVPWLKPELIGVKVEDNISQINPKGIQWECSECYCFNDDTADKCMACLAPKANQTSLVSNKPVNSAVQHKDSSSLLQPLLSSELNERNIELICSNLRMKLMSLQAEGSDQDLNFTSSNVTIAEQTSPILEVKDISSQSVSITAVKMADFILHDPKLAMTSHSVSTANALDSSAEEQREIEHADSSLTRSEQHQRPDSEDDEVCFLFEELPDPELVSKAKSLMLPASFYFFKSKPRCTGCRGCSDDNWEDVTSEDSNCNREKLESKYDDHPSTDNSHDIDSIAVQNSPTALVEGCIGLSSSEKIFSSVPSSTDFSKKTANPTPAVVDKHLDLTSQKTFLSTEMLSFTDIAKGDAVGFRKESGFQFHGTGLQLFGSHHDEASESEEYEPDVDFKPLVSLPDEYEYKSGGDDGTVLFEHRCKLYRHDERSNEWKERGLGNIRIFLQVSNQKPRIIMRRDQILKLCCNHYITKDMKLLPKDNDRCWAWQSHSDYSEETPRKESFTVRFKTASVAEEFRRVFQECIDKVPFLKSEPTEGRIEEHHCNVSQESLQWECSECYCFNSDNTDKCMACLAPKPNTTSITSINPVKFPTISKASSPSPHAVSSNGSNSTELTHSNSRIQLALLQAESEEKDHSCASSNMISTGLISTAKEVANVSELSSIPKVFTPSAKSMSNTSESSAVEESAAGCNDNLTLSEKYQNLDLDGEVSFLFEELPDPELVTKAKALMLPPSFYLFEAKPKCSGCRGCSDDDSVEDHTAKSSDSHREVLDSEYSDHPATGISHDASSSFKEVLSLTAEVVEEHLDVNPNLKTFVSTEMLSFTDIAKGDAFGFRKETGFQFQGTGLQLFGSHHDEASESEEYEPDVDFKPLVSLPDEYEYKSGGDDGMVLFEHRCKLYRHDERSNEWKERGLGNIQIFLQASNQKPRIIMRRDQILKLCCNHYITKDMKLLPKDNDRCWAWQSHSDYSEETPRKESFTVRFKTASTAEEFRRVFQECVEKVTLLKSESIGPRIEEQLNVHHQ